MSLNRVLAAALDDEIVILDTDRQTLLQLDTWAAQVWRSCDGATTHAIASSHGTAKRVRETLRVLRDAGLIRQIGREWVHCPVEWV